MISFELATNVEKCFSDAYDPIKKLLLLLRSNYEYILKIVSIIDEDEKVLEESKTLVDLFCHQFYENILIPNPEQEELLILSYLLLEKEVISMNSASASSFIDENASFVGKFLKSFTKRQEIKSYLSMTFGKLILSIESVNDTCLDLNPMRIAHFIKIQKEKNNNKNDVVVINDGPHEQMMFQNDIIANPIHENLDLLTQNIPKCTININKTLIDNDEDEDNDKEAPIQNKNEISLSDISDKEENTETIINEDYKNDLNQEELNIRIQNETNHNLKEFYIKQLERINKDTDIFTNKKFFQSLSEYGVNKMEILLKYKENFLFIKEKIDCIIQILIDKITTIPYTLRCLCKMIYILIQAKFDKINQYEKNAFVGQFIFGKCILPILINSDINAIITTTIINVHTRQSLKIIAKVLDKINRGLFFESNIDTDFTIFNHYIIEVIPLLNTFYEKLIDVELPRVLDSIVKERMESSLFQFRKARVRKNPGQKKKEKEIVPPKEIKYNYFNEHKDESSNLQCMCFSIEDIILLVKIVKPKIKVFDSLPQNTFFVKTIDRIFNEEHKLMQLLRNSGNSRKFFVIWKEEQNENYLIKKEVENYTLLSDNQDSEIILQRLKFCIKTILKGLNILNNKDYSYLNMANTNHKFLHCLKLTLDDLDDFDDFTVTNKIPLKWYSQYLTNNKRMLPEEYKNNDYLKLYTELLEDEMKNLNLLKDRSSIVMTRNGMNIRCAEKIIEKAKKDLFKIQQIKRFMKIEKFINQTEVEVCIRRIDQKQKDSKKLNLFKRTESNQDPSNNQFIKILPAQLCPHKQSEALKMLINSSGISKSESHAKKIKDFIKQIISFQELKQEIIENSPNCNIYNCFNDYMTIIRNAITTDPLFSKDPNNEFDLVIDKIDDYIMKKIYCDIFPKEPIEKDVTFYKKCIMLSWITPAHLEIKKLYVNELKTAIDFVRKINEGKSVYDKLQFIASAHNTINNTIKFSSGKGDDAGAEELSPIFQYIIIKAKPTRFYSNINYIKAFLDPSKLKGMHGFLLSQMEFAASFIVQIDYNKLRIPKEQFDEKCKKAIDLYNSTLLKKK